MTTRPQSHSTPPKLLRGVLLTAVAALGAAFSFVGCGASRSNYETAPFPKRGGDGDFSIREYGPMVLVSTPMAEAKAGENSGFRRLFRYISGENAPERKVAMTTPVFLEDRDTSSVMSFVLPDNEMESPPKPTGRDVYLRQMPAHSTAVVRFSGRADDREITAQTKRLRKWMDARGLTAIGAPVTAQYDPPWTPGPMRRNEVIIPIADLAPATNQ